MDSLEYGNAMRFINHSSSSRANCIIKYVYLDGLTHCIIVSCVQYTTRYSYTNMIFRPAHIYSKHICKYSCV